MNLLGIDVGTTGCKAAVFSQEGNMISLSYTEYNIEHPQPRMAELPARHVWEQIQGSIREAVIKSSGDGPVGGISVTSMGENVVPVSREREILGPSILNIDCRGEEYLEMLSSRLSDEQLHRINGNVWGNQYTMPKLLWIKEHQPELYERTYKFLHWAAFVTFMLGSEPAIDYSLANRSLLFDVNENDWSEELLAIAQIDRDKLPKTVPSGTLIGHVGKQQAESLGIPEGTPLVAGAHDQCANALGCGVIEEKMAMYGMGTFPTIAPVYKEMPERSVMIRNGLNIEHHAVPERYVSFIFHMGGSAVKWFRDTFAEGRKKDAEKAGLDVYPMLFDEMPDRPAPTLVLPRFAPMGPPDFEDKPFGSILGLSLETKRGDILKGMIEANTLALKLLISELPEAGIEIDQFLAVGGGSKTDKSIQIAADILGKPLIRSEVKEAGALGAAILAGIGIGLYSDVKEASKAVSRTSDVFEPDNIRKQQYQEVFESYRELRTMLSSFSETWNNLQSRLNS